MMHQALFPHRLWPRLDCRLLFRASHGSIRKQASHVFLVVTPQDCHKGMVASMCILQMHRNCCCGNSGLSHTDNTEHFSL